jgi:hypothetical protein
MTTREAVFPFGRQALYERNRYSPAIKSNGFLFVSGQVGSREDGSPEEDLNAQIRLAFDNLNAVLALRAARSMTWLTLPSLSSIPSQTSTLSGVSCQNIGESALPDVDRDRRDVAVRIPV